MTYADKVNKLRAGMYMFRTPLVCHANWTEDDWINYIDGGGGIWLEPVNKDHV